MTTTKDINKSAKKSLRKLYSDKLQQISQSSIQRQSNAVCQHLITLKSYQNARNVSVYLSMPGEIDTNLIIRHLFNDGKSVFVPSWNKDEMIMVRMQSYDEILTLPRNKWNIPEPKISDKSVIAYKPSEVLDLILMPGVCFDRTRMRLGHGKGYYDKFIAIASKYALDNGVSRPQLIALSLNEQISDDNVPTDAHDQQVDMVISESEESGINQDSDIKELQSLPKFAPIIPQALAQNQNAFPSQVVTSKPIGKDQLLRMHSILRAHTEAVNQRVSQSQIQLMRNIVDCEKVSMDTDRYLNDVHKLLDSANSDLYVTISLQRQVVSCNQLVKSIFDQISSLSHSSTNVKQMLGDDEKFPILSSLYRHRVSKGAYQQTGDVSSIQRRQDTSKSSSSVALSETSITRS
ncbi:hypothetical protein MP228_002332 [Amoeboaphelidium protococcarum]|nr:hypothetical protein MP228_002332 [Amoeboaphelidium protococcarum]